MGDFIILVVFVCAMLGSLLISGFVCLFLIKGHQIIFELKQPVKSRRSLRKIILSPEDI